MSNKTTFTIGADPEVFIFNKETQEYIPSFELFEGSKNHPTKFGEEGFGVLCDNAMVEFNIPPANCYEDFYGNLVTALEFIQSKLPHNCVVAIEESAEFEDKYLDNPGMLEFGCAPQSNIYNIQGNNCRTLPPYLRFAGGHIHIGLDKEFKLERLVKCMDIFVGLQFENFEKNEMSRKNYYGMPGTFRETSYGLEYRTPSNSWLQNEESVRKVYEGVEKAVTLALNEEIELISNAEVLNSFSSESYAIQTMDSYFQNKQLV